MLWDPKDDHCFAPKLDDPYCEPSSLKLSLLLQQFNFLKLKLMFKAPQAGRALDRFARGLDSRSFCLDLAPKRRSLWSWAQIEAERAA